MEENEYGKTSQSKIFTFLRPALLDHFEARFLLSASILHITDADNMWGHASQI